MNKKAFLISLVVLAFLQVAFVPAFGSYAPNTQNGTANHAAVMQNTNSLNWAGYVASSNMKSPSATVTSVAGSWIVQNVTGSGQKATYSSQWIGIGGFFSGDSSLIQTGTESDYNGGGATSYSAWWELLPAAETTITGMTVTPGDIMQAHIFTVSSTSNLWNIYLNDTTKHETFYKQVTYASSKLSAEWIEERPQVNGHLSTLADFGTAYFGQNYTKIIGTANATISGVAGSISSFSYESITMVTYSSTLAQPSLLNSGGTSFTVTYVGSTHGSKKVK